MKKDFTLIYSTVPDEKTGKKIIKHLLEKNLVACGNLFSEGTSFFHWEGKIQTEKESVVILKTSARLYKQIETEIKKLHPYDCPCILSLPVKEGYNPSLIGLIKTVQIKLRNSKPKSNQYDIKQRREVSVPSF